jgi:hypothetical protein
VWRHRCYDQIQKFCVNGSAYPCKLFLTKNWFLPVSYHDTLDILAAEKAMMQTKYELDALHFYQLKNINPVEFEFWEQLRLQRLLPDSVVFAHDLDLKG